MERLTHLQKTGFAAFFLSGICAISSGVIVSILKDLYGFSYGTTGTMLSFMSIGNMAAAFLAGMLPATIGMRKTAGIICIGYFAGYLLMTLTGAVGLLMAAFLIVVCSFGKRTC